MSDPVRLASLSLAGLTLLGLNPSSSSIRASLLLLPAPLSVLALCSRRPHLTLNSNSLHSLFSPSGNGYSNSRGEGKWGEKACSWTCRCSRVQQQIPSFLLADARRRAREEQTTPSPSSLLSEALVSRHLLVPGSSRLRGRPRPRPLSRRPWTPIPASDIPGLVLSRRPLSAAFLDGLIHTISSHFPSLRFPLSPSLSLGRVLHASPRHLFSLSPFHLAANIREEWGHAGHLNHNGGMVGRGFLPLALSLLLPEVFKGRRAREATLGNDDSAWLLPCERHHIHPDTVSGSRTSPGLISVSTAWSMAGFQLVSASLLSASSSPASSSPALLLSASSSPALPRRPRFS